jgi:hypothetical protein
MKPLNHCPDLRGNSTYMEERRTAPRHRVLKGGRIEFAGINVDCTVRNLSDSGAALEVANSVGIPSEFILVIPQNGFRRPCHATWRSPDRIGVLFD